MPPRKRFRIRWRIGTLLGLASLVALSFVVSPFVNGVPDLIRRVKPYVANVEPPLYGHLHDGRPVIRTDRARRARCRVVAPRGSLRCPARRAVRRLDVRAQALGKPDRPSAGEARSARAARDRRYRSAALPADQIGRWGAPFPIPVIGINSVVLPTGKVLWFAYPRAGDPTVNEATAWLFDPATGATNRVDPPTNPATGRPWNIWCSGQALLADGRVLVVGGNLEYSNANQDFKGLNKVFTFNPFNETWTTQPDMRKGRWYPTVTTLPDGRALIISGYDERGIYAVNEDVDVFTPSADMNGVGTIERKFSATRYTELYPHMWVLPGGKVLAAGPDRLSSLLDTTTWTWQDLPPLPNNRIWGGAVLMPGGPGGSTEVMMTGGVDIPATEDATASTIVLDLTNPGAGWRTGPPMVAGRAQHNTVILPDDSLLTVGGGAGRDLIDLGLYRGPIYQSEILDPGAAAWRAADVQTEERTYHSTAVLLPDGRVLAAGDDRPGHKTSDMGELYEPPYLYKGARPTIGFAPGAVRYGAPFRVSTGNPAAIARAVLVRPGSTTHANDMDQRSIKLAFTVQADGLTLTTPADATLAPPGYYMLFLLDAQGVPSSARFVRLDPNAPDAPPLPSSNQPPSASFSRTPSTVTSGQTVTFTSTSSDPDGTIVSSAWDLDDDGAFDDAVGATASRTFPAGNFTVRLRVTDDHGATADASAVVPVAVGPNLLTNPSFESNLGGWVGYRSTLARVALAGAPAGGFVARVTRSSEAFYTIDDSPDAVASAAAGSRFTATARVRASSASAVGKSAQITIRERLSNGSVRLSTATVLLTNAFQPLTVSRTTEVTGSKVDIYVGQQAAVAGNAFYIDQVSLVRS